METLDQRLASFVKYEKGWMNGEGDVFSAVGLDWLCEKFETNYGLDLLPPARFPTLDGGVQFEWVNKEHDVSLEVNLKDKTGYLHYLNLVTGEDEDSDYDLDNVAEWGRLNIFLFKYLKII